MLPSTVSNTIRTSHNPYSCSIKSGNRYLGNSGIASLLPITLASHPADQYTPHSLPFQFSCNLTEHPLFRLPRLVQLMQSIASYSPGKVTCLAIKEKSKSNSGSGCILRERFSEITALAKETGLLILINEVEEDPKYQFFLDVIMNALTAVSGKTDYRNSWVNAYISITPSNSEYVLGDELNFLFRLDEAKTKLTQEKSSISISIISLPKENWKAKLHIFSLGEPEF
jgi:hypothetical protein